MQAENRSTRLISIDALRGIAALGVVLYHAVGQYQTPSQGFFNYLALPFHHLFTNGYVGVFLFFVISGFCIHLQWARARAAGVEYKINFRAFWKRRLRRLYPPYLIAFAIYLIVAAYTSGIDLTHFFVYDVGMHLLMLHNLDPHTCYSINGVFWTLAIEEQLYLAYFLLLFIRTRWGWTSALIACALARVGWYLLSYYAYRLFEIGIPVPEAAASHWLTWALGALSVEAAVGLIKLPAWCRDMRVGIAALLAAAALSYVLPIMDQQGLAHRIGWLTIHPMWGLGFFILVNWFVKAEMNWRELFHVPQWINGLAYVGVFSYSLYLTHQLVIMAAWRFIIPELHPMLNNILVITPASIIFAWIFFCYAEKPYMKPATQKAAQLNSETVTPAQDTASA